MSKNYAKLVSTKVNTSGKTPQTVKVRQDQVKNNAGGYVFQVSDWNRLNRFLILGSESDTYYVSSEKLSLENAKVISNLLSKDGRKVVDTIVEISEAGRAPKQDATLFALAMAATYGIGDDSEYAKNVRSYAFQNLNKVARIFTHLAIFSTYCNQLRGWGKGLQKAISRWYNLMDAKKLSIQVCKYGSRSLEGESAWSHKDLLRKAHTIPSSENHNKIFKYITKGKEAFTDKEWNAFKKSDLKYIWAHDKAKNSSKEEVIELINDYGLFHESIPTDIKSNKEIYDALIEGMPLTALIRNLGTMTKLGTIAPLNKGSKIVAEKLENKESLKKARIHPISVLAALKTYSSGHGFKGTSSWSPVPQVESALDKAFYDSFNYVEPTGKNILIGLDVSGSMSSGACSGIQCLTPAEGAAALGMTIAKTEKNYHIYGFADTFRDLKISSKDSLNEVLRKTRINNFGGTDCALPIQWALKNKADVDAFIIITDNETYGGFQHVFQALNEYRSKMNKPNAKLICVAMTSTAFSIGDEKDVNTLNISGFDTNTPEIISEFIKGNI
jgi:60 kDa SS-A/Ro ribonucleoprotein